ncbi:MAG: preprotein translocase subunit SecA [Planctomycetota bacterium]
MIPWRTPRLVDYRGIGGSVRGSVRDVSRSTWQWVGAVRKACERLKRLSTSKLTGEGDSLRKRDWSSGLNSEDVIDSFALTSEALRRVRSMEFYDVQLAAGFALASGIIAEIETGEGKTITTALPAALHAWRGQGVHVATTNAYLSQRDFETLRSVYEIMGLTAANVASDADLTSKANAYRSDITYAAGYEFGFDFLRDQVGIRKANDNTRLGDRYLQNLEGRIPSGPTRLQRALAFTIVDEADSVMVDEASTPLILGATTEADQHLQELYRFADRFASGLSRGIDFDVQPKQRRIWLTDTGRQRCMQSIPSELQAGLIRPWPRFIEQALFARALLRRDAHYIVDGEGVSIVDENTGRIHRERRWSGGLQQAVEAKEQTAISPEQVNEARVSRQRFFGFYDRLAGMTGTAADAVEDFRDFYQLPVVRIPTHRPSRRRWLPLRCFADENAKLDAITDDIRRRIAAGQPVLLGSATIEESQNLSRRLAAHGVEHTVLNGIQDAEEASIIATAGSSSRVTVATSMAGRGTDIKIDEATKAADGLHVIGTQVQFSRRVDRQLAGRAARQGEPGSVQFYCCAEDPLLRLFHASHGERMKASADSAGESHADMSNGVRLAQQRAEQESLTRRRQLVRQDNWIESIQSSFTRPRPA